MYIATIRVTHHNAPHEIIDRLIMTNTKLDEFYRFLLDCQNIDEVVVLQTCNRFEVYFSGSQEDEGRTEAREALLHWFDAELGQYLVSESYMETLMHLFRVSSSLDSMIVGENQILAQARDALDYASKHHFSGRILEPVFQKAISVGRRARSDTKISKGKVSISSAAVDLANQHNPLDGKYIVVIGTGKMASLLSEYLNHFEHSTLCVVGRNPEKLEKFCSIYSNISSDISELPNRLRDADVLFSATSSPRVLVNKDVVENAVKGRSRSLTLIDIAMPADIDPAVREIPNVHYFCIDDLKEISEKNMDIRRKEIDKVEDMIRAELYRFKNKLQNLHMENYVSNLYKYTEDIRKREVEKTLGLLGDKDPEVAEIMEDFSKSLMKKLMHNFMMEARENPRVAVDMEKFVNIFMGNGHVSNDKNEKTSKQHPHKKHGD